MHLNLAVATMPQLQRELLRRAVARHETNIRRVRGDLARMDAAQARRLRELCLLETRIASDQLAAEAKAQAAGERAIAAELEERRLVSAPNSGAPDSVRLGVRLLP